MWYLFRLSNIIAHAKFIATTIWICIYIMYYWVSKVILNTNVIWIFRILIYIRLQLLISESAWYIILVENRQYIFQLCRSWQNHCSWRNSVCTNKIRSIHNECRRPRTHSIMNNRLNLSESSHEFVKYLFIFILFNLSKITIRETLIIHFSIKF